MLCMKYCCIPGWVQIHPRNSDLSTLSTRNRNLKMSNVEHQRAARSFLNPLSDLLAWFVRDIVQYWILWRMSDTIYPMYKLSRLRRLFLPLTLYHAAPAASMYVLTGCVKDVTTIDKDRLSTSAYPIGAAVIQFTDGPLLSPTFTSGLVKYQWFGLVSRELMLRRWSKGTKYSRNLLNAELQRCKAILQRKR